MADPPDGTSSNRRDLTLVLSAVGAIFAGLVGTNVLDLGSSAPKMRVADHAAIVLWLPALLLLAICAYKAPDASLRQRRAAWAMTAIAGIVTAGVLLFTGFGFTRDTDHVLLWLTPGAAERVRALCGFGGHREDFYGTIRTETLQQDFVIVDLARESGGPCSVDIPQSEIREFEEHPPKANPAEPS
jgi:hypothetical protein